MSGHPRWVPLELDSLDPDPFLAFEDWYAAASELVREPEAICVATADGSGQPSARMVLLRARDHRGFCFFTNYESDKGRDLAENPQAAILWYVEPLGRQVRIEGPVERLAPAESDAYFASRPRGHQLGAHASRQSRSIEDRRSLEEEVVSVEARFEGLEVPRPATASCRPDSSSGSTARTDSTTGSSTRRSTAAAGSASATSPRRSGLEADLGGRRLRRDHHGARHLVVEGLDLGVPRGPEEV